MEQAYQNVIPAYPRFPLAHFPSPLHRAERMEAALRDAGCDRVPRIYLKRDDLLSLAMGGSEIRNLEFQIGEALAQGATDVVTTGRQQSNHCRLTAAACAKAGIRAHLVLAGMPPERFTGNLLLARLLGARIYFSGSDDSASGQAWIDNIAPAFSMLEGCVGYVIPEGGSDARGAVGHALGALELLQQCDAIGVRPTAIVLATSTGGTQAGMLAGLRKAGRDVRVVGFAVAKPAEELAADVRRLVDEVAAELGGPAVDAASVVVDGGEPGDGYGAGTAEAGAAIELLARSEGVLADPVHTGKGLAGLVSLIRDGSFTRDDAVLFIHTGGAITLFA
ncbi:MAG: pyridoxal-phosphate dependent enzyme [Chloroflexi bacterium]|nr:pyridoxal-phosphate dependent enzyme [Chloroflexota bacterium]